MQRRIKSTMTALLCLSLLCLVAVLLFPSARYVLAQEKPTIDLSSTPIGDTTKAPLKAATRKVISRDSIEGKNVVAAAELMKEFGFNEEAKNVLEWLDSGKISSDELESGTFGETNPFTGNITIDNGTINPRVPKDKPLDRNAPNDFSWLLNLAATLVHEKEHAHQPSWYILASNLNSSFWGRFDVVAGGREHPAEQDAWTKELSFLDQVIAKLKERIRQEKDTAPKERLKQLFRELDDALWIKITLIGSYYSENYGPMSAYPEKTADELQEYRDKVSAIESKLEACEGVDWDLFGQVESGLDSFMALIEPKVEEWLAGAAQRSSDAEGKIDFVGTIGSISAIVARSSEFTPGDWFSGGRLLSHVFIIKGDSIPFDASVVLVMPFDPQYVTNINQINIYRYKPSFGHWEQLADNRSVDQTSHTISAEISSFSVIGVFEDPPDDLPFTPSVGVACFIATAAYGTPMAEEVDVLRDFRDQYLITNPVGKAFVDFYYEVSPPMAEFITEHPAFKAVVRVGLMPAVALSRLALSTTLPQKVAIVSSLVLVSALLVVWAKKSAGKVKGRAN